MTEFLCSMASNGPSVAAFDDGLTTMQGKGKAIRVAGRGGP
jgi:hypothetical protein